MGRSESEKPGDAELLGLARTVRSLQEGSPEREAYLARLRDQISRGTYQVDSVELAKSLLRASEVERRAPDAPGGVDESGGGKGKP